MPIMDQLDPRGGILGPDLRLIHHGTPEQALKAAKRIGFVATFSSMRGMDYLEQEGTIRAIMQVFDTPNVSMEDIELLDESVGRLLLICPRLAAQVVAACADPDPRIAFAALATTRAMFRNRMTTRAMLEAGAVPAVMSALKHSNAYCRAIAASVAAVGVRATGTSEGGVTRSSSVNMCFATTEALEALLEAGLVPALMDILRTGRSHDAPPAGPGVFSNVKVEFLTPLHNILLPNCEPAIHACNALQQLALSEFVKPSGGDEWRRIRMRVVPEVVKAREAASVLLQCLQQYDGELQVVPGLLFSAVLRTLEEDPMPGETSPAKGMQYFCKQLIEAGFPDLMPSLIRRERGARTAMLQTLADTFRALGCDCLPADRLPVLATACAKCVEEGGDGRLQFIMRMFANECLNLLLTGLWSGVGRRLPLSEQFIETLAGIMVSCAFGPAASACHIILSRGETDQTGKVFKAAMSGGFVPGTFRLAQDPGLASSPLVHDLLIRAVQWVAASGDERYVIQAVNSGLLSVLQTYLRMPEHQLDVLKACTSILTVPSALAKLREAGFVPAVLRASHSVVELGRWVSKHCRDSGLAAEFVAAGLLEKLEQARREMRGQLSKKREVAALIDELARIGSGQPAKQSEAGASSETPLRVPGKGSAADGGREQPGERKQRPAEEQVVRASASGAGGEGPRAQRDPDSSEKCRQQRSACMQCGKSGGDGVRLLTCSRCRTAVYCGSACQRSHWRQHKAECTAKQAAAEKLS